MDKITNMSPTEHCKMQENEEKGKLPRNLSKKTIKAIELANSGMAPRDALETVNGCRKVSANAASIFKKKLEKYSLLHPQTVKLANKVILDVLRGTERKTTQQRVTKSGEVIDIIETIAPSHTNQIEAAKMVYDRFEPIIKINENNNNNTDMLGMVVLALQHPQRAENRAVLGKVLGKVEQDPDVIDIPPVDK
jgi:hypothetical protein